MELGATGVTRGTKRSVSFKGGLATSSSGASASIRAVAVLT